MKTRRTGKGSTLLLTLYVTTKTTWQETNLEVESHSEPIESLSLSKKKKSWVGDSRFSKGVWDNISRRIPWVAIVFRLNGLLDWMKVAGRKVTNESLNVLIFVAKTNSYWCFYIWKLSSLLWLYSFELLFAQTCHCCYLWSDFFVKNLLRCCTSYCWSRKNR